MIQHGQSALNTAVCMAYRGLAETLTLASHSEAYSNNCSISYQCIYGFLLLFNNVIYVFLLL